jgi:hypothetical protein
MYSRDSRVFARLLAVPPIVFALALAVSSAFAGDDDSVLKQHHNITVIGSTVPTSGDVNPYGVARVNRSSGNLHEGHFLVSNFNNSLNLQGTGTTIVDVAPNGTISLFSEIDPAQLPGSCPGGVGLTTALAVLRTGWVIVGSLPTSDGTSATAQAGCLIVLNNLGQPVETFYGSLINGPWDMTAADGDSHAKLFVTNVLNGTVAANGDVVNQGTLLRINLNDSTTTMPAIESITVIGSGFAERTDPVALVIGPTGVGLSPDCGDFGRGDCDSFRDDDGSVLYVADTLNNRIAAIPDAVHRHNSAGTGETVTTGGSLNLPLGLAVSPGGHILTVNGGDGFITETTPRGNQVAKLLLDNNGSPAGVGALFGLAFQPDGTIVFVDDDSNTVNLLH